MRRNGKLLTRPLATPVCGTQPGTKNHIGSSVRHRPGKLWYRRLACTGRYTGETPVLQIQWGLVPKTSLRCVVWMMCLLLIACASQLYAQKIWSQVTLDRASAYVGQPVEVRITVYTSTWFTSGIDPGNIKVNGAYTIYFRPVSRSFQQGGQNYAGVELIYHVFPYRNEDVIFPSLDIEVESPPEGDFKGVKRTLKSAEKRIRVKPIPPNFSDEQWLVATGLTVTDNWSGNRQKVKVGDVLVRSIARTAYGTVGQLIPPIAWDSLPGISMYPARTNVENHETKTAIRATRTETMRYLFEEEGEITLPEMVFSWYNPYRE